jgi:hypothetical protein
MCPVCVATAAWIAAAAVSTGGVTALVFKKAASGKAAHGILTTDSTNITPTKEDQNG